MPDTFGGEWHRPRDTKRKDRQRGHSAGQLQQRASFDNEPQLGCGAMFFLCVLAIATVIGLAVS